MNDNAEGARIMSIHVAIIITRGLTEVKSHFKNLCEVKHPYSPISELISEYDRATDGANEFLYI